MTSRAKKRKLKKELVKVELLVVAQEEAKLKQVKYEPWDHNMIVKQRDRLRETVLRRCGKVTL